MQSEVLRDIPLFALLDDQEMAVLAAQVELVTFAERQRIYKMDDLGGQAYLIVKGKVRVTTVDAASNAIRQWRHDYDGGAEFY